MTVKTAWESRVGQLLDPASHPDDFAYSFKPADSAMYGGQPRIDWLAADVLGRFWMIEVKSLRAERRSINVQTQVSTGQRAALSAVGRSAFGLPLLAVGQGKRLYIFAWRDVVNRTLVLLSAAPIQLDWSGPKQWKSYRLYQTAEELGWFPSSTPSLLRPVPDASLATSPAPSSSSASSTSTPDPPSPSTWKPPGYIRTRPLEPPSER